MLGLEGEIQLRKIVGASNSAKQTGMKDGNSTITLK